MKTVIAKENELLKRILRKKTKLIKLLLQIIDEKRTVSLNWRKIDVPADLPDIGEMVLIQANSEILPAIRINDLHFRVWQGLESEVYGIELIEKVATMPKAAQCEK